jgi:capsular exopolysaccharide synthesis family protein
VIEIDYPQPSSDEQDVTPRGAIPPPRATSQTTERLRRRMQALRSSREGKLIVGPDTPPAAVEQYRRLAAVLHHAQVNRGIKRVMVASAFAAEGKSLTSTNLALTLSESYQRRVLLIDADLRRPTLHDTFQIPNLAGLSDWLKSPGAGRMPLVEITPRLSILPGGRPDPDPMGGLASDRMERVVRLAAERFDWVILDTPPVAVLPDGNLMAAMVDAVVLVVAARQTPAAAIQRAVAELGHERIIGVVLNRVDAQGLGTYAQSYYYQRPALAESRLDQEEGP